MAYLNPLIDKVGSKGQNHTTQYFQNNFAYNRLHSVLWSKQDASIIILHDGDDW